MQKEKTYRLVLTASEFDFIKMLLLGDIYIDTLSTFDEFGFKDLSRKFNINHSEVD